MHLTPFISTRQEKILEALRISIGLSASGIKDALGDVSLATVKRDISALVRAGFVISTGRGRGARYERTKHGELFTPVDARAYCAPEPDARNAFDRYDHDILSAMPRSVFSQHELANLEKATAAFRTRAHSASSAIARKELERFVIELSWKSSRIEGNTYTLFDTERLLREGVEAPGHSREEALMIINHKRAFEFVYANRVEFKGEPSRVAVEELHRLLTEGLNVGAGPRRHAVGIIGTRYRPLDNQYQIHDAMEILRGIIGKAADLYTAGLAAVLGISYIQPFEDGNKRTARLLANAVLLARECAPLSYRSADETAYREATLVFYETHSLVPFKNIFLEQYLFAAEQYGIR